MKTIYKISKCMTQGFVTAVALAALTLTVAGCVYDPYPPPPPAHHTVVYSDDGGVYSYYTYPNDYRAYEYYDNDDNWRARRDRQLRMEKDGLGHTDDRNFHNRDDFDNYAR